MYDVCLRSIQRETVGVFQYQILSLKILVRIIVLTIATLYDVILVGRVLVLVSAVTNVTYRLEAVAVVRSSILFSFYDS
jgi:hypothetical protein